MAISTYTELQTAVQNWLDDASGNQTPAARVQEFIALAEADIRARLRDRRTQDTIEGVVAQAEFNLPAYFGGVVSLGLYSGESFAPLAQLEPNAALEAYHGHGTGTPAHFTVGASTIRLFPEPDAEFAYRLVYWKRLVPLSDQNTSNWLLLDYPAIYLFGALSHAAGYLADDARLASWRAQYEALLAAVMQASNAESYGNRTTMYISGGTP